MNIATLNIANLKINNLKIRKPQGSTAPTSCPDAALASPPRQRNTPAGTHPNDRQILLEQLSSVELHQGTGPRHCTKAS